MSEWVEGTPVGYSSKRGTYRVKGRVYRAATQGPPLLVKEILPEELPTDKSAVVIEYESYIETAGREFTFKKTKENISPTPVERLIFQGGDARSLCRDLIQALADGGDQIATHLLKHLENVHEFFDNNEGEHHESV